MDHISDAWLLAYSENRLAESKAGKTLLHLLVCEQCCKLADLYSEYVRIATEALREPEEGESVE